VAKNGSGSSTSTVWSFTTTTQQGYTISALAGTGVSGYSGANGPPGVPSDLAVDGTGNVYIADVGNHRIRLVTQAGAISTVAGSGGSTDSGDRGPATAAGLNGPWGIAVDSQGNLYMSSDSRIRKVAPNGIISTVAGNDTAGYNGDGNPATNSQLNRPRGLAVDAAGNLYVADYGNNCIRKIAGSTISTVAGRCGSFNYGFIGDGGPATSSVLNGPTGVAVDSTGNLYIADSGNASIRKVSNGIVTTVAGGGDPRNSSTDLDQPLLAPCYIIRRGWLSIPLATSSSRILLYPPDTSRQGGSTELPTAF
jgi:sugar lactone lactonase YvrE